MSMSDATDARLRSPEVARRLGIDGADVYRLIFDGELDGRPDTEGIVSVSEGSVEAYLDAHGRGAGSNIWSNEPRRTQPDDAGRSVSENTADVHEDGPSRTKPDHRTPGSSTS